MYRRVLTTLALMLSISTSMAADQPSAPDKKAPTPLMDTEQLKFFCLGEGTGADLACKLFIQGVVETWMYRDAVSAKPPKFEARNLTFCEKIFYTSEDEWKRIVRSALTGSKAGLPASYVVMTAMHDEICKDG